MANFRIAHYNHFDDATVTVSPTEALSVNFAKNTDRDFPFRSSSTATTTISIVFAGSGVTISHFGMYRQKMQQGTVRLALYSTTNWTGTPLYDVTVTPSVSPIALTSLWGLDVASQANTDLHYAKQPHTHWIGPFTGCKSAKIVLSGASSYPYFEVGRFVLSPHYESPSNAEYGLVPQWIENTQSSRSRGQSQYVTQGDGFFRVTFDIRNIPEADRPAFLDLMRHCGRWRDVVVSQFPTAGGRLERDFTYLGRFSTEDGVVMANPAFNTKQFVFEEI